jgi:quinolinate synthase
MNAPAIDSIARAAPRDERGKIIGPRIEWSQLAPIPTSLRGTCVRTAVALAHNRPPETFHDAAETVGDRSALVRQPAKVDAKVIGFASTHFMAKAAKPLNLEKTGSIPDVEAGCPLDSPAVALHFRGAVERMVALQGVCHGQH